MKSKSRGVQAGEQMADVLIEMIHLMYQKKTAQRVLQAIIHRLQERFQEFKMG